MMLELTCLMFLSILNKLSIPTFQRWFTQWFELSPVVALIRCGFFPLYNQRGIERTCGRASPSLSTPPYELHLNTICRCDRLRFPIYTMNRKRNFTDCELETLLTEVEARRRVLLGTLSSGITRSRKTSEWESVCRAVNAAGSEQRTVPQVKKKWSDMKVQVKRKVAALRPGVALTPCDERLAALVGVTAVTGVVGAHVGDSEFFQGK